MGLFSRKIKDGARGTARVVSSSAPPDSATYSNCAMSLVVQAEGIPAYSLRHSSMLTPTAKWPWPGTVLPVIVDRNDHERIRILWDEMETHADSGMQDAEALARSLRGDAPPATPGAPAGAADVVSQIQQMFPGAQVQVHSADGQIPADAVQRMEQAFGRDLDGDGVIGPTGGAAAAPPPSGAAAPGPPDVDDRLDQLERLAKLREAGALTDAEFQAEKARILGA